MRSLCPVLVLAVVALSSSLGLAQEANRKYPPSFDGVREELYKHVDGVDLKLWVFEPPSHSPQQARPAIVFFFGGGWNSGTPAQFEHQCRYLAKQGMVAIAADYRVRSRHHTTADRCVADAKSAIRWVRQHAARLGVDPNRIVAAGGSAGGHLAACTATLKEFDEPAEDAKISSEPNALALFNPAVVLAPFDGVEIARNRSQDLTSRIGVEPVRVSPIHHLRSGLPPTIIFHGEADTTVGFDTVKRFSEVSQEKGNRCELVSYPGAGHGFFNYGRGGVPGEHYLDTLNKLHDFLHSIDFISTRSSEQ